MGEGNTGLSVADALALRNSGNGNNGMFGDGSGAWWLIILILFLGGGWGNRGYGYGSNGGNGDTNTVFVPTGMFGGNSYNNGYGPCCTPATAQGMTDAFNFNSLDNGITATHDAVVDGFYQNNLATTTLGNTIQQSFGQMALQNSNSFGQAALLASNNYNQTALQNCQGFNSVNNSIADTNNVIASGVNSLQNSLCNGFNSLQTSLANNNYNMQNCCCETREAIMNSNFANQTGFNNLATSLASNACEVERGQDDIKTLITQMTNTLAQSSDNNADRIINHMVQTEMDNLRSRLENAELQLSQAQQTSNLINALNPAPIPAYSVPNYRNYYTGANNGCGCGNYLT